MIGALPLPSGRAMPLLGFGTWQLRGAEATSATRTALETGYRLIDTATVYRNEREVGTALRESGVDRTDVFVTTKLPPDRTGQARETLTESLRLLGLDHVDLWLVHWPPDTGAGVDTWRHFVAARDDGLARDIGVSNYSLDQIDEVTDATGVRPAVNQIPWSPLLYDAAVEAGHRERGVVLEGYSALKKGALQDRTVAAVAERTGRTPAQVVLRWHLQHEVVAIPKSAHPDRIAANFAVDDFTLSDEDMAALDALGS